MLTHTELGTTHILTEFLGTFCLSGRPRPTAPPPVKSFSLVSFVAPAPAPALLTVHLLEDLPGAVEAFIRTEEKAGRQLAGKPRVLGVGPGGGAVHCELVSNAPNLTVTPSHLSLDWAELWRRCGAGLSFSLQPQAGGQLELGVWQEGGVGRVRLTLKLQPTSAPASSSSGCSSLSPAPPRPQFRLSRPARRLLCEALDPEER